mgnify:CR=1 FL=1
MNYSPPQQPRAIKTERQFLDALDEELKHRSFNQVTIDQIAERAGLHRGAFLKRFGTKKAALLALFDEFCDVAYGLMSSVHTRIDAEPSLPELLQFMSGELEKIQVAHFSANRAMYEFYLEDLKIDPRTKGIFMSLVQIMRRLQERFAKGRAYSEEGAYAAAQCMITINYTFLLKAMPAYPQDPGQRHALIAQQVLSALWIA